MTSAEEYRAVKALEDLADRLGFYVTYGVNGYSNLCLCPKGTVKNDDDQLPCYTRDATFGFGGTVETLTAFLYGWNRHMEYMNHIGATNEKQLQKKVEEYRHKRLLKILKSEKHNVSQN